MKVLRHLLFGLLLIASGTAPLHAGDVATSTTATHAAWRMQGSNCIVHLLGSVHVLKDEHYPLPAVFESAFSNANIVVFETDIGGMMKPETQSKLLGKAMLPDGVFLKDHLSKETYASLQGYLKDNGLPEMIVSKLRPGFAMMTLVMLEVQKLGFQAEQGMDLYFYRRAQKQKKSIRELESLEFQVGLICELDKEEGESLVKSTLDELKDAKHKFEELLGAWQRGNEAELEKILNEANRKEPELMKRLVTDRNARWTPQIEDLARGTNNVAVVVGAAHLVGKDGVVDMLRRRGWTVTQE
jgi:uncharacterized protein YbaP (TraB family)